MGSIAIHYEPAIAWQKRRVDSFVAGLRRLRITHMVTRERERVSDVAIVFGTTLFREVEKTGHYLLVDRASFDDPHFVQLVWNGHGRRGDHMAVDDGGARWEQIGCAIADWRRGKHTILCGQTEPWSPHFKTLNDFYAKVQKHCDLFRPHPRGDNPTNLRSYDVLHDVGKAITLNSSIGVECVMRGIPTVTMDEAAMAWDVTSHDPRLHVVGDRDKWLHWLAWTQWSWEEIEQGKPISHLFDGL